VILYRQIIFNSEIYKTRKCTLWAERKICKR